MRNIFLAFLLITVAFSIPGSSTDWNYGNPTGLGLTNIPSDQFIVTNNNASTGDISSVDFNIDGTYNQLIRINKCNNCLYGMINPIDGSIWGTDEQGNIFYSPNQFGTIDYSAGFFTAGAGGSCSGLGGNCNPLFLVGSLQATTNSRKLTVDSDGNVYVANNNPSGLGNINIFKYVRSLGYTQQLFYSLTAGVDFTVNQANAPIVNVHGIIAGSDNSIFLLIGSQSTGSGSFGPLIRGALDFTVISPSGVQTKHQQIRVVNLGCGGGSCTFGYPHAGLVLDSQNQLTNFTYAFNEANATVTNSYILHNSSSGSVDVGGTISGITDIFDIGYNDFKIFVASDVQNKIRTYATNFQGYGISTISPNPSGITGTFSWVNGYNTQINTITPGASLAYRWTISSNDANYTYFSGWSPSSLTEPTNLQELTDLTGLSTPAVFLTNSNTLAGTDIFGFLLAKRKNDSTWSQLASPTKLTISPSVAGFDSITLSKIFYNLTGDTISATFTYSSGYPPYFYQWQLCSRADCADGKLFNTISLISQPSTSSMSTNGMATGNYYAVMMRHLPFLSNEIVASQRLEIRPPVIGVSWDKTSYNLYPKSLPSVCNDSTPSTSYFTNISGYAGLQRGWFSCGSTPSDASANNSIMRGSLYAKYDGTFYLNNSFGSIWNGTLSNGSGALVYILTNSSPIETWTLTGVNQSGETFYATTEVDPESLFAYTISVSPNIAYNGDTLYLTFTKPLFVKDNVEIRDASGMVLVSFDESAKAGSYYIDPGKQYTYGTWTAYWKNKGSGVSVLEGKHIYTFTVKNAGKPKSNASILPADSASYTGSAIGALLQSTTFWGLILVIGIMFTVSMIERRGN